MKPSHRHRRPVRAEQTIVGQHKWKIAAGLLVGVVVFRDRIGGD